MHCLTPHHPAGDGTGALGKCPTTEFYPSPWGFPIKPSPQTSLEKTDSSSQCYVTPPEAPSSLSPFEEDKTEAQGGIFLRPQCRISIGKQSSAGASMEALITLCGAWLLTHVSASIRYIGRKGELYSSLLPQLQTVWAFNLLCKCLWVN
jgi:hypothetical protein